MIELIEYNTECFKLDNGMTITIDYGEMNKGKYVPDLVDPVPILLVPKSHCRYMRIQLFDKKEKVKGSLIQKNNYYFLKEHIEEVICEDKQLTSQINNFKKFMDWSNKYISSKDNLKKEVNKLYDFALDNGMRITLDYGEMDKLTSEFYKDTVNKFSYFVNPYYKVALFDKKDKLITEIILKNQGYRTLDKPIQWLINHEGIII